MKDPSAPAPPQGHGRVNSIRLVEGMAVEASDGLVGEIADVVIDPLQGRLTHLVVQPGHHHDRARLIPIDAVADCDDIVTLSWSTERCEQAEIVEETEFIELGRWPQPAEGWGIGTSRVLAWPYYGSGGIGLDMSYNPGDGSRPSYTTTSYDRIPAGTAEIRRSSEVVSSDNHHVGHVDGFIVDPDNEITHIVLERGHIWGHREVTIPMREVDSVISDRVHLRATRDEIGAFPTAAFHRHDAHGQHPVHPRTRSTTS